MIEIPLTQGKVALIDDADWPIVEGYKWYAFKAGHHFYAIGRNVPGGKQVLMHRLLLGKPAPHLDVDHADGNGLNNQRSNIRVCTRSENSWNRGKFGDTSSRYKGVSFHKAAKKWCVQLRANDSRLYLGLFTDEAEAARAYDAAAIKLHGEFAHLNFPA